MQSIHEFNKNNYYMSNYEWRGDAGGLGWDLGGAGDWRCLEAGVGVGGWEDN